MHGAAESASTYKDKYLDGTIQLPENTKIVIIQSSLTTGSTTPWYRNDATLDIDDDNRNNLKDVAKA